MSSLLPERQLVFSVSVATTLGLEEAIFLQHLSQSCEGAASQESRGFHWFDFPVACILRDLPFWTTQDLQRITENLRQQGVLLIASAPFPETDVFRFAVNGARRSLPVEVEVPVKQVSTPTHTRMVAGWQPDQTSLQLLAQNGVPNHFARDQVVDFVHYWTERGEARSAWGTRFAQHCLRRWREYEAHQQRFNRVHTPAENGLSRPHHREADWLEAAAQRNADTAIEKGWSPSDDAREILQQQAGVHANFIEDAIPEFVLYWSEKGERCNTWNARFINHVKRQWAQFQHAVENDSRPTVIAANWQPGDDVYDVLKLARIDLEFARQRVPEFVMYWRERNEVRTSWNTLFLQYAKRQWQLLGKGQPLMATSTRERSFADDLNDRSWAG